MPLVDDDFYWPSKLTNQIGLDVAQYEANWHKLMAYCNGHKANHAIGGSDRITPADIGAAAADHTHGSGGVSGLDATLAAMSTADSVPTFADVEARAAIVRGLTAGSGFLDWGGGIAAGFTDWYVSPGMLIGRWADEHKTRIRLGGNSGVGLQQGAPVVSIKGHVITLMENIANPAWVTIPFPAPPATLDENWRQDIVILEAWFERVALKDVVYPLGNVQFGNILRLTDDYIFPDGSAVRMANNLVNAKYCSYGDWDTAPAGGLALRWSALTERQKRLFAMTGANNVSMDAYGDYIQLRWRIRVIRGKTKDPWANTNPLMNWWMYFTGEYGGINPGVVIPRGQIIDYGDFTPYTPNYGYYGAPVSQGGNQDFFGQWSARDTAGYTPAAAIASGGFCHAIPIALVSRNRNTGIYHATHNPRGCASATGAQPTSPVECFSLPRTSGMLGTTSANPSGRAANELVPSDIIDQRMYARHVNYDQVIEEMYRRYRAGLVHRKEYVTPSASVGIDIVARSSIYCPNGVLTRDSGYNPATGEIVYPTTYAGTGAVSVATLTFSWYGQGLMQLTTDPAVDGIIDINLGDVTTVELPYFVFKEPNGVRNIP